MRTGYSYRQDGTIASPAPVPSTTMHLTLTDHRATFIEKSVLQPWLTVRDCSRLHRDYIEKIA